MTAENQVCTVEQALKLKSLGINQDSYFSWCGHQEHRLMDNGKEGASYSNNVHVDLTIPYNNMELDHREDVPSDKPFSAAYNVAELGAMITAYADNVPEAYYYPTANCWFWQIVQHNTLAHFIEQRGEGFKTEAQARAAMLIYLLENKMVETGQVNANI